MTDPRPNTITSARIALATLAALAIAACSKPAPPPPPPVAVSAAHVERRTLGQYESLDGTVDPFLSANLAPQQSGTLVAIYANEGDRVSKGEVLAKIDDSILRATLTQQQATDVQNVAKLSQSKIQLPITTVSNDAAFVQAQKTQAQEEKTKIADRANVANTKLTYDADRSLVKQGFVAASVFEQARAAYVLAQQTLDQDNDKLAQDRAAVTEAKQNLANTPLQQQVIAQNQGAVEQSQGLVQQYRSAVAQTTIEAPFDGIVTARTLDPGSYASPSQSIFSVSQLDPTYVDFNVKDSDLAFVHRGSIVSFATSANPNRKYVGSVSDVNGVPTTGTLLYRARIIVRNPDYSLRGGLEVTVRVTQQLHRDTLTLPREAIVQNGTKGSVYEIVDDGNGKMVARQKPVNLGLQSTEYIEVSGNDVREGMPVVLNQTDNLHDGLSIALPTPKPVANAASPEASP